VEGGAEDESHAEVCACAVIYVNVDSALKRFSSLVSLSLDRCERGWAHEKAF